MHLTADSPDIRYYGRWEMQDKKTLTGQGATYIRAKFTGSSDLQANLTRKGVFGEYSIDGKAFHRLEVKGNGPLTLDKELDRDKEHLVTLVRSTEGRAGISEFNGFILEKSGQFIAPLPDKKRLLKIRQMNPQASIICLEPVPSCLPGKIRTWIADSAQAQHDAKIYFVPLNNQGPILSPEEYTDGSTQPNILGHIKLATYLKDKIATIMEWK